MVEHNHFFPRCSFVTGRDSTNVPLGEAPEVPSDAAANSSLQPKSLKVQVSFFN